MEHSFLIEILTVLSIGLMAYAYVGYPLVLWIMSSGRRDEVPMPEPLHWPTVTVVISAYNEEKVIGERIKNLLDLDYPRERLNILVGSDGSNDRTCEIVLQFRSGRVKLLAFEQRRGKASVVNDLVAKATGDIVVLTDANTFFERNAVSELVAKLLRHPSACTVVGQLELRSAGNGGNLDGLYWRYETWIKRMESRFGAVLGANGAIYAIRRKQYEPLPTDTIVDDFLIPMLIRLRWSGDVLFAPSARAWELCPEGVRSEFRRRVRIGAGDLQALLQTWPLLSPRYGMLAVAYWSHKVLRWCGPLLLLTALIGNLWLLENPMFRVLLGGQLACYGMALSGPLLRRMPLVGKVASGAWYFLVLNAALFVGYVKFALGAARPTWSTTPRILSAGQGATMAVEDGERVARQSRPAA